MRYFLFLDESGDHGLANVDPNFPFFVLAGVLFSEDSYNEFDADFNALKEVFWEGKEVIFHSRDIRKCQKEFAILLDYHVKSSFYSRLNQKISDAKFTIFAAAVDKEAFARTYGTKANLYSMSLTMICERAYFHINSLYKASNIPPKIYLIAEKRGKKEDKELLRYYNVVLDQGTSYVGPEQFGRYGFNLRFKSKSDDINGLQVADLIAYPIATYCMRPKRANPAYDLIKDKIYTKDGKMFGLKRFPKK